MTTTVIPYYDFIIVTKAGNLSGATGEVGVFDNVLDMFKEVELLSLQTGLEMYDALFYRYPENSKFGKPHIVSAKRIQVDKVTTITAKAGFVS